MNFLPNLPSWMAVAAAVLVVLSLLRALQRDRSARALAKRLARAEAERDVAERRLREKAKLLSLVSHDLRTPLAALELQLGLFARGCDEKRSFIDADSIARARRCSRRIRDLVESLLGVARAESGRLELRMERVDLFSLADSVLEEQRTTAHESGLRLQLEGDRALPELTSDRHLLRLVLVNLVGHAVKNQPNGGVTVRIEQMGDARRVLIAQVNDNVTAAALAARVDRLPAVPDAHGRHGAEPELFLTVAEALVHALGGEVRAVSSEPANTAFELSLPAMALPRPHAKGQPYDPTPVVLQQAGAARALAEQ